MATGWPRTLYELPRSLFGFHIALARRKVDTPSSLEDRVALLELDAAARHLLNRYAYCYDGDDLDGMMEIYTDESVVVNRIGTFVGIEAIRSNYDRAIKDRTIAFHRLSNLEIEPNETRTEAWVTAYLYALTIRGDEPGGTMATCVFHIGKREDAWKILESRVVITDQHSFGPKRAKPAHSAAPTRGETAEDLVGLG
jgi:ketosteroid isomerase-like protein